MVESSFAGKVTIAKYSNDGEIRWRLPGILPSHNDVSTGWLLAPVEDGSGDVLYGSGVALSNPPGSSGTVARISTNGLVIWQRAIEGVSRFARIGTELLAFGSTVSSNVFTVQAFPVNLANGAVGAKRTYSQPAQSQEPNPESPRTPVLLSTSDGLILKSYWPSVTLKLRSMPLSCSASELSEASGPVLK